MSDPPIVIVGAGLAGLCCARRLQQAGLDFLILESRDRVGGRVQTEELAGFRLDFGFQVLLSSYPEVANTLDLSRLNLGSFQSGALIRSHGKFVRLVDPWREPRYLLSTALANVGSFADKFDDQGPTGQTRVFSTNDRWLLSAILRRRLSGRRTVDLQSQVRLLVSVVFDWRGHVAGWRDGPDPAAIGRWIA
jgi:phytoene dehydrogenase-like protein